MNNKRIGKIAVTAIVSIISTITAVAVTELTKGIKKDVERNDLIVCRCKREGRFQGNGR